MGRMVCRAVAEDPDMALVAGLDRSHTGESVGEVAGVSGSDVRVSDDAQILLQADTEVAVDFTHPSVVMDDVRWAVDHAMHIVVGTTGVTEDDLAEIEQLLEKGGDESNVIVAPNFAIGAVLAQRFAAEAARYLPAAEIIELHHEGKADAPSGTALATARRIVHERAQAYRGPDTETVPGSRGGDVEGVRIHSVRLPGLVAHQEVILGGTGQILTIRHDSLDRSSFMPGVLIAIREIVRRPGLTVGLEQLLEGSAQR
ncbi:MAG: 4-hydroxy-tetrahydrodipicolinate reductase [Actinomycetota bacterium]|nr:4-hydroxy-tetrahydrodipicolinate reductase [Actinomycetota bacterium]